jgi:hypothetical protein
VLYKLPDAKLEIENFASEVYSWTLHDEEVEEM